MPAPALCVLGSVNLDLTVRAPALPLPGQTVLGGPVAHAPGGKGANQAVAAARMGAATALIGCLGRDQYAPILRDTLARNRVDLSHLTDEDAPTGLAVITVDDRSENTIVVAPGANARLSPDHVRRALPAIRAADVLLISLESPLPAIDAAIDAARDAGAFVALNAAPAPDDPRAFAAHILPRVDALIVNHHEARALASAALAPPPSDSPQALADALLSLGPPLAVITLGPRGAIVAQARPPLRLDVPSFPVTPVDSVGAGDTFSATLAVRLAEIRSAATPAPGFERLDLLDACTWACAAGALATTAHGAIPAIPDRNAVRSLLAQRP